MFHVEHEGCGTRARGGERTGDGEVGRGGIVGMNREQVEMNEWGWQKRHKCVFRDGLGSRGTGEVYELLIG